MDDEPSYTEPDNEVTYVPVEIGGTRDKIVWGQEKYQCPYCELKFRNLNSFKSHLKTHKLYRVDR